MSLRKVSNFTIQRLVNIHEFVSVISEAIRMPNHCTVSYTADDGTHTAFGGWTGDPMPPALTHAGSRAPLVSGFKETEGRFFRAGDGWDYGPARNDDFLVNHWAGWASVGGVVVAVSALHEQHDKLLALLGALASHEPVELHHVGFRGYSSIELAHEAAGDFSIGDAKHDRGDILLRPTPDHWRAYVWNTDRRCDRGGYFIEFQQFPAPTANTPACHLDFEVRDPEAFLRHIDSAFIGVEHKFAMFDKPGPNDPHGVVWIPVIRKTASGEETVVLGVMARPEWSDVRDWPVPANVQAEPAV